MPVKKPLQQYPAFIFITIILLFWTLKTNGNILILNGLTHEHQTLQGEVTNGTIVLKNLSEVSQSVQLYQRDYWFSYNGENRHDDPGTLPRSNAKWIKINPTFVTLKPNETATIEYEITVPDIDTLSGTYWSVIMVEGLNPPDTTANNRGIKINTIIRYAVQIITNIGDTGVRNLSFEHFNLSRRDSVTELSVALENKGQRILRPELSLQVYDSNGASQGIIKAEKRRLYPGTSAMIVLDLSKLKVGSYKGLLIADCGDDYVFGSNLTLDIKDE